MISSCHQQHRRKHQQQQQHQHEHQHKHHHATQSFITTAAAEQLPSSSFRHAAPRQSSPTVQRCRRENNEKKLHRLNQLKAGKSTEVYFGKEMEDRLPALSARGCKSGKFTQQRGAGRPTASARLMWWCYVCGSSILTPTRAVI